MVTSFLAVFALTVTSPAAPPPSGANAAPPAAYAPAPAPVAPAPSAAPVVSVVIETPREEVVDPFSTPQPRGRIATAESDLRDPFAAGNLAVRQVPSQPIFESSELRDPFGR